MKYPLSRPFRLLCLLLSLFSLSGCGNSAKLPADLIKMEETLSAFYSGVQYGMDKEETTAVWLLRRTASREADSPQPTPSFSPYHSDTSAASQRNRSRLKEIYKLWNTAYPALAQSGAQQTALTSLDSALNQTGMYVDNQDDRHTLVQLNEAVLSISDLYAGYNQPIFAEILRLEYQTNLLFLHSNDNTQVAQAVQALKTSLDTLRSFALEELTVHLNRLSLCVQSIQNAAQLDDAKLIELKSALLKEDICSLKKMVNVGKK